MQTITRGRFTSVQTITRGRFTIGAWLTAALVLAGTAGGCGTPEHDRSTSGLDAADARIVAALGHVARYAEESAGPARAFLEGAYRSGLETGDGARARLDAWTGTRSVRSLADRAPESHPRLAALRARAIEPAPDPDAVASAPPPDPIALVEVSPASALPAVSAEPPPDSRREAAPVTAAAEVAPSITGINFANLARPRPSVSAEPPPASRSESLPEAAAVVSPSITGVNFVNLARADGTIEIAKEAPVEEESGRLEEETRPASEGGEAPELEADAAQAEAEIETAGAEIESAELEEQELHDVPSAPRPPRSSVPERLAIAPELASLPEVPLWARSIASEPTREGSIGLGLMARLELSEQATRELAAAQRGALPAVSTNRTEPAAPASASAAPAARTTLPELDCVIEPDEVADVGSPVPGVIERVLVERSDRVEAGQLLARLESEVETAQVELARERAAIDADIRARAARLALGERVAARNEQLFERRALSREEKEQAETEVQIAAVELERSRAEQRMAQLELARARAALARRSIASPLDGVVVERFLSAGELVQDQALLRVARIDPLRVEVVVPADHFGRIQNGMRAEVLPETPAEGRHAATVVVVDRVIDAASRTFGVRLELPNPEHQVPAGLGCKVRFLSD